MVLGLANPPGEAWQRLRAQQTDDLTRATRHRIAVQALTAGLIAWLFADKVATVALLAWFAAVGGALFVRLRDDIRSSAPERAGGERKDTRRHLAQSVLGGLVWCAPLLIFGPQAGAFEQVAAWAIIATLTTTAALTLVTSPITTVTHAAVIGLGAMALFAVQGLYLMIVVALTFTALVVVGTMQATRNYLTARIAEAGVDEKEEVVSLLLREFEENEADWLWQIDPARRARAISPRFAYALGRQVEDAEGEPFLQLICGDGWSNDALPASLHDLAERLKRRESFSNLLVKVLIGKEERWWELSGTPILAEDGRYQGHRGVGSDVTERQESDEKIAYLARFDTLTGLPNRLMVNEALGEALQYAEQWRTRCALLMVDLDRFKAVNDSLGHLVGDRLLAVVSKRLQSLMSENETCGRLGGDEFAIVMREARQRSQVEDLGRRIIDALSKPYEVDHHTLYVGASVGSAQGPRDGSSVEELMRNADLALYRAKEERGQYHGYEPALHALAEERRKLELSLRHALERRELALNFQPVVDTRTETLVSFEALLRWQSKEHGFVSPGKFIPLAEDTRLIVPIGEWVLHEACRQAMRWPRTVRVAVNVSAQQLAEPDFAQSVVRALAETGLDASRLEIEVTESIFLSDPVTAQRTLEEIMALGCGIALDDFGTGYSSLGYLRQLRFSTIKVDRSFVQGAAKDSRESVAIIRAVVAMADSMEMTTTAEGVETEEELELIRSLGCDKIQGYYFGRPMPAEDACALFGRPAEKAG